MNRSAFFFRILGVGGALATLTACQILTQATPTPSPVSPDLTSTPGAGLANPASVYCEGLGYQSAPIETDAGQDALCIFPDGSHCNQWDFLAGRCGAEFSLCALHGGTLSDNGTNIGTCTFADGSTCSEFEFFSGDCRPASFPTQAEDESVSSATDIPAAGVPVVGWMGFVLSTPDGSQFDDFVVILPAGEVGEFGIQGASEVVQTQIEALRDRDQPGRFAHFWGTLTCGVPDFGGCQLLAERLRVDGPGVFFDPDPVEGWEGTIVGLTYDEPGAPQPDDAFVPTGDYPVQYGIDSAVSSTSGERDLNEVIVGLRDSGEQVRIWGDVMCGVPDAGGCRIEVFRIAIGDQVYEIPQLP